MSKKTKRQVKNKNATAVASVPLKAHKNKNINKIVVNVNSNNKKKVISKQKGQQQPSSNAPIVISNPSPMYIPQYQQPPTTQLVDNSFGLGVHKLLDGLTTRMEEIKEDYSQRLLQNKMENEKRTLIINELLKKQKENEQEAKLRILPRQPHLTNPSEFKGPYIPRTSANFKSFNINENNNNNDRILEDTTIYNKTMPQPLNISKSNEPTKTKMNINELNISPIQQKNNQSNILSPDQNILFGKSLNNMSNTNNDVSSLTLNENSRFSMQPDSLLLSSTELSPPKVSTFETPVRNPNTSIHTTETFDHKTLEVNELTNKELIKQILQLKPNIQNGMDPEYELNLANRKSNNYDKNDSTIKNKSTGKNLTKPELIKLYNNLPKRSTVRPRRKQRGFYTATGSESERVV